MIDGDMIAEAWRVAEKDGMYVVVSENGKVYIEPPWEEPSDEAALRLFLSQDACAAWKNQLDVAVGPFNVGSISMSDLFEILPKISEEVRKVFGAHTRVDLCGVDERGWPVVVDVLFREAETTH